MPMNDDDMPHAERQEIRSEMERFAGENPADDKQTVQDVLNEAGLRGFDEIVVIGKIKQEGGFKVAFESSVGIQEAIGLVELAKASHLLMALG